ncbi:MAG: MFS family permease [Flavobacterium sp.]|jgi:MFS family permease
MTIYLSTLQRRTISIHKTELMKPLHFYLLGAGSWFLAYGIQVVTFAWIVTIVLHESAKMVGFAQMAFMIPATLFMLPCGSLADQIGGRRIAIAGHILASTAPLFLIVVTLNDHLNYTMVLLFAMIMGTAQAFITPSRDGLLALVAEGEIQKKVVIVSVVQFGIQLLGFVIASFADQLGVVFILSTQFAALSLGAYSYYKLEVNFEPPTRLANNIIHQVIQSVHEGYQTVKSSSAMSAVVAQNIAVGIFFMGAYTVTIPLLIREVYEGSAAEISWINAGNSLGLVTSVIFLMRFGNIARKGRALLLAQFLGCFALAGGALGFGIISLIMFTYFWGMCGGISMTMSRVIMQEMSPPLQRGRMMAFYSFSFMGSGPFGALFSGYLCEWLDPKQALLISTTLMALVIITIHSRSTLWKI